MSRTRYDVLLVSKARSRRVADQGLRALCRYLLAQGLVRDFRARELDDGLELVAQAGSLGHAFFYAGESVDREEPFRQLVLHHSAEPWVPEYGPEEPVFAAIELRETLYNFVTPDFLERIRQMLYLDCEVFCREHVDDVPMGDGDELAVDGANRARGGTGTDVEEV